VDCSLDVPGEKRLVWQALHTVDDLPRLLDPPGGSVQNANNSPWYTTSTGDLDPARYPPYVERGDLALRPQLALQLLDATPRFSPDDVIRLKYDTRMLLADRVKPALLSAIAALPAPSPDLQRARDILAAWDNRVDAPSNGAVLFSRFWETYRAAVAQPFEQPWSAQRPFETPSGLGNPAAALEHLERAGRWVREQYGSEAVAWGDVHRFRFGDLDLPGDGAAGQLGLYRRVEFDAADNGKRVAGQDATGKMLGSGDAWVLLVHFARPVQAWSVLAYGQSGDPGSPHTRDQIRVFANRDLRPAWFTEAEIAAHLERSYRPGRE
jgi:acyl-homoserine-lactone acylase